jgi:hypothetical protein
MVAKTKLNEEGYEVFADSGKLVHRWAAEKKYGREAVENKEVHHIDGDKRNNHSSNLLIVNKEDHYVLHQHQNKVELLMTFIALFSGFYLFLAFLGFFKIIGEFLAMNIMRICVVLIFLISLELKFKFFENMVKRPNEKIWKN